MGWISSMTFGHRIQEEPCTNGLLSVRFSSNADKLESERVLPKAIPPPNAISNRLSMSNPVRVWHGPQFLTLCGVETASLGKYIIISKWSVAIARKRKTLNGLKKTSGQVYKRAAEMLGSIGIGMLNFKMHLAWTRTIAQSIVQAGLRGFPTFALFPRTEGSTCPGLHVQLYVPPSWTVFWRKTLCTRSDPVEQYPQNVSAATIS